MSEASQTDLTTRASDLTAFQQNVLVTLSKEPMYGLAIKDELKAYYGADINHGRLYPNLDELVEMGFVEKSELDKRTNQYELTDDGLQVVRGRFEWTLSKFVADESRADEIRDIVDAQL